MGEWGETVVEVFRQAVETVPVQAEFFWNGDFVYRYDLSRCGGPRGDAMPSRSRGTRDPTLADDDGTPGDAVVGAFNGGYGECVPAATNLTSILFRRVVPEDSGDRDGDGIPSADEIFVHGTDPGLPDTDGDGVPDGAEVAAGTDPLARDLPDADILARVEASATNEAFLAGNVVATNSLAAWTLLDGFSVGWPAGATNVVWERRIPVARTSAWQQYFVSASPSNAAPWRMEGLVLEWELDGNGCDLRGSLDASPVGDSWRVPLGTDDFPTNLVLRLRATGASALRCPTPLRLAAYAPEFRIGGGAEIVGRSGARFHVFTRGSESVIRLSLDHSRRPHHAPVGQDECDMAQLGDFYMASGGLSFSGDMTGGTLAAGCPGIYELPDISLGAAGTTVVQPVGRAPRARRSVGGGGTIVVLSPSAWWSCEAHGCGYDGLGYDWDHDRYYEEEYYPLDSRCLRRSWQTSPDSGVSYDNCELVVTGGCGEETVVTTSVEDDGASVSVDGVQVWSKRPKHVHDYLLCGNDYREDYLGDGCDGCDTDCANGNCDSLEGPTLGSLKFRIPLGAFAKGYVAGFAWFSADGPVEVSRSMFRLKAHPSADVTDTAYGGTRRIASLESRGRDLRIEDIADGARVTIYDTAAQTLEHAWEITNVNGDPARVRFRKISRLDNVMSDETFAYDYASGDWARFDNVAQVGTQQYSSNDFADYGDGTKSETRTTADGNGNVLESVTTEQSRIGECDNAVMRETYREEWTGNGWKMSWADYWNDPQNRSRHGKPRLVQGNARAWTYTDFDEDGRETLRVEQRGDAYVPSEFPRVVSNELLNASLLDNAFMTVCGYEPLDGDSCHDDDSARPRAETRYVVTNGVAVVIGRTLSRYTRLVRDGHAAIKRETWRGGSPSSATVAYSYDITYAYTDAGTPFLMRGAVAESLDENGTLTVNSYSLSGGVLACETRRYGPETGDGRREMETFETMDRDAAYGTVLRRTTRQTDGGTVIADERSIYDNQNRLRSTTYFDGTSLTNAYSCCRLLWWRDRQNRTTLRSAQTGTDHLYNAYEETWITNLIWNAAVSAADLTGRAAILAATGTTGVSPVECYRVTQHFYDALGRETNTVTYAGSTPGEAAVPIGEAALLPLQHTGGSQLVATVTTAYPYGGSSYSIRTDERGVETTATTSYDYGYVERNVYTAINGTDILRTTTRTCHGGGSSIRREWPVGSRVPRDLNSGIAPQIAWTEERRFTEYAPNGYRIDYVVTTSSDHYNLTFNGIREYIAITNSISTYDLLGRLVTTATPIGEAALSPLQSDTYSPAGDLLITHTYTNNTDILTETYAYDMLGNRIATTDALGNTTYRTYDPFGRILSEWGASYPVRYTYDTQGRRTSLSTTRDGTTWDTTTWAYDPYTGNCTSKTYADGSTITYTYTPDNLPLRTTYASGRWRENVYDSRRLIVGVIYSDDEVVSLAYDEFGNETAASNEVSSVVSLRSEQGDCTNETIVVSGGRSSSTAADETLTISRTFDAHRRLTGIDGTTYAYDADGLLASVSNDIAVADYVYTPDRLDSGYSLTLSNGVVFSRSLVRDGFRRSLVTGISSVANGVGIGSLSYTYDALSRPTTRNNDSFGYNARSEVTAANVSGVSSTYGYDEIGNSTNWAANCLNQYAEFTHDADGNMTQYGDWSYTYDAANRLKTVSLNGVLLVTNFYDAKSRRVKKVTPVATTTFFYDNWNLVEERIAYTNGTSSTIRYFWGKDLSGTLQGAGGVGGLLYLTIDGVPFIPCYDNNGNVTRYLDANGNIVAQYTYDAFGNIISKSGPLADFFRHRFSTKYYDDETGLYYYGYRFYSPPLIRWLNRDPIAERGGVNLYVFCCSNALIHHDKLGNAAALTWMPRKPISGWYFSSVVWNEASESLDFTVSYTMSETERKCCHSVTVDRYVRKILGIGNRFGSYDIDHAADGGMTDAFDPYVGYAEGDSPDGQTLFIYRLPWTQSFKWEARCTSGPNKGKILSTIERKFRTSGHWLWNPKREGRFL